MQTSQRIPAPGTPEARLAEALRERLGLIADRAWVQRDSTGHLRALQEVSERIDSLSDALPPPVHPQLKHYLERCSYDKALAHLSGNPPEPGDHAHH